MKQNLLNEKSYAFAIRIVNMYKFIVDEKNERVLSKQCLRSGTAVGALVAESEHAQSKSDFLNKINIALKEANETLYWLSLLHDTGFIGKNEYLSINADATELVKMLASIVKTTKQKLSRN